MVALNRRILVFFLVLLQYAAPWLHAHSGGDFQRTGLHCYEFEHADVANAAKAWRKTEFARHEVSAIVGLGSVITAKHGGAPQPSDFLPAAVAVLASRRYAPLCVQWFLRLLVALPVYFRPTSRAPPAFNFRYLAA